MMLMHEKRSARARRADQRLRRHIGFDALEYRLTPSSGLNTFAQFADVMASGKEPASVEVHVEPGDFDMPRGRVVLGFAVRGALPGTVDPTPVVVRSQGETAPSMLLRRSDIAAESDSLTLAWVGEGDYTLRWRAERGTTGPSQLDVFLAGDANADFRVDARDLELVRRRLGVRQSDPRYMLDADVNRDGVISRGDLALVRMNLGVATSIRPPILVASLSPDSDPDGNGVVLRPQITVVGQTTPGATVRLVEDNNRSLALEGDNGALALDPRRLARRVNVIEGLDGESSILPFPCGGGARRVTVIEGIDG